MRPVSARTQVCAVIGDPVGHSLSPAIFNAAFNALELDWVYVAFPVTAGRSEAALQAMREMGLRGLSVTMPHKDDVARLVDHPSSAVAALGACNSVLRRSDGSLEGHNTDGDGFVDAFAAATGRPLAGLNVLVVGAGGAARSVIEAVARAGAASVIVLNRTLERAETAAALAGSAGRVGILDTPAAPVSTLPRHQHRIDIDSMLMIDVVVNASSVGMETGQTVPNRPDSAESFPRELLRPGLVVADIVYRPFVTPLLAAATEIGAVTVGGLGMLIHQAAHQFRIWTGHDAPIAVMTAAAQAHLGTVP
jgi:shikimate dehydrogenase